MIQTKIIIAEYYSLVEENQIRDLLAASGSAFRLTEIREKGATYEAGNVKATYRRETK